MDALIARLSSKRGFAVSQARTGDERDRTYWQGQADSLTYVLEELAALPAVRFNALPAYR